MLLDILQALGVLLAIAFVGRVVLSLLPVGALGAHGARELPATWAASHLLGLLVFAAQQRLVGALELGSAWSSGWAFVAPWALVAAIRVAFLPGALVPRHEPRGERVPASALGLGGFAAVLAFAAWWIAPGPLGSTTADGLRALGGFPHVEGPAFAALRESSAAFVGPASLLALLVHVANAFAVARRAPIARALALLWLAWLLFLARGLVTHGGAALLVLAFGAGAATSAAWLRRGDQRALASSALACGSVPLFDPTAWAPALACIAVLFLASPRAAWRSAAVWCAPAGIIAGLGGLGSEVRSAVEAPSYGALVGFLVPALALAASAYALRVLVLRRPDPRERIDSTTREALAVGAMLVLGSLASLALDGERWTAVAPGMPHVPATLLPFLGLVPLLVGLVGAPDERTLPPA